MDFAKIFTIDDNTQVLAYIENDFTFDGDTEPDDFVVRFKTYIITNKNIHEYHEYHSIWHFLQGNVKTWHEAVKEIFTNISNKQFEDFYVNARQYVNDCLEEGEYIL